MPSWATPVSTEVCWDLEQVYDHLASQRSPSVSDHFSWKVKMATRINMTQSIALVGFAISLQASARRGKGGPTPLAKSIAQVVESEGWTPVPELSSVFYPGRVFERTDTGDSLVLTNCIEFTPMKSTYAERQVSSSLSTGVSVRGTGTSGELVRHIQFASPEHVSIPSGEMQISASCARRLRSLSNYDQRRKDMYVVRETLQASVSAQRAGTVSVEGAFLPGLSGLGEKAQAEWAQNAAILSTDPVTIAYRTESLQALDSPGSSKPPQATPGSPTPSAKPATTTGGVFGGVSFDGDAIAAHDAAYATNDLQTETLKSLLSSMDRTAREGYKVRGTVIGMNSLPNDRINVRLKIEVTLVEAVLIDWTGQLMELGLYPSPGKPNYAGLAIPPRLVSATSVVGQTMSKESLPSDYWNGVHSRSKTRRDVVTGSPVQEVKASRVANRGLYVAVLPPDLGKSTPPIIVSPFGHTPSIGGYDVLHPIIWVTPRMVGLSKEFSLVIDIETSQSDFIDDQIPFRVGILNPHTFAWRSL